MKTIKTKMLLLLTWLLPMFFLCSCYEIVYVSQEKDEMPNGVFTPSICVQVYMVDDKPVFPIVGMLVPQSWHVKPSFPFVKSYNGYSMKMGNIQHSKALSKKMEQVEPAPIGYFWWVGSGTVPVKENGAYNAYPMITTSAHAGTFMIDYMVGDSENGLNVQRSNNHPVTLVNEKSAAFLQATAKDKDVFLKWKGPKNKKGLIGYYIYRNDAMVNEGLVSKNYYTDHNVPAGSYAYAVKPVYINGSFGEKCVESKICFTPCGTSMLFNGNDAKMVVFDAPSLHLSGSFAIEAWFNQTYSDTPEAVLLSKGEKGTGYELVLTKLDILKSVEFRLPMGTLKSTTRIYPDTWYHVAAVFDGKLMKIYINGRLDCERFAKGMMTNNSFPLIIGKSSTENRHYFNGLIDEVRVWNTTRSAEQIKESFSSPVKNTEKGLVGNWTMSEGCSLFTCDASQKGNDGFLSNSCWCPSNFPYVEDVSNQNNYALLVPVINYLETEKTPDQIILEFKINPKLFAFEGIVTENSLLDSYTLKTLYMKDGTIRIKASKKNNVLVQPDKLVFIDLKPLQPHINSYLKFNRCVADGQPFRVGSGQIIATALPGSYKTGTQAINESNNLLAISPNPASAHVNLQLGDISENTEIRIVSITGQEVFSKSFGENESNSIQKIDLSGFSKGIYLISLQTHGNSIVKKLAVN